MTQRTSRSGASPGQPPASLLAGARSETHCRNVFDLGSVRFQFCQNYFFKELLTVTQVCLYPVKERESNIAKARRPSAFSLRDGGGCSPVRRRHTSDKKVQNGTARDYEAPPSSPEWAGPALVLSWLVGGSHGALPAPHPPMSGEDYSPSSGLGSWPTAPGPPIAACCPFTRVLFAESSHGLCDASSPGLVPLAESEAPWRLTHRLCPCLSSVLLLRRPVCVRRHTRTWSRPHGSCPLRRLQP